MIDTGTKQKANNVVSNIICLEEKCENAEVVEILFNMHFQLKC